MAIGGTTYPFTIMCNVVQQSTQLTYPYGDVVITSYTSQGWLSGVSETLNSTTNTLLSAINYQNAAGAAQKPSSALMANGTYQWNLKLYRIPGWIP